jgi:predicted TIM-barrel fold metal-dependent hydrolase
MRSVIEPGSFYKLEDLLAKMAHYGIKKGLVYHSLAREYNALTGNSMLMEQIGEHSGLMPVWVVMHHHTGEFPPPDVLRKEMAKNGVKAVRMFPGSSDHGYSIAEWNCGELFEMLQECGVPLIIGLSQIGWNELNGLCGSFPSLNVILTDLSYSVDRNLYGLLKKHSRLHIETTGYKVHNGIEEICGLFGAHRLVFGSRLPEYSAGSAAAMLNYARISYEEKQMIASGNLERLIGGVAL